MGNKGGKGSKGEAKPAGAKDSKKPGKAGAEPSKKDLGKQEPPKEASLKILIIGDASVGKTSLLLRFCDGTYSDDYTASIPNDFKTKNVEKDGQKLKLNIWDSGGQERFRTLTSTYYKGCHGIVIAYDLTNKESFENLRTWIQEVERYATEGIPKIIVGCKGDSERTVNHDDAEAFCSTNSVPYAECSAKTGTGIEDAFTLIAVPAFQFLNEHADDDE